MILGTCDTLSRRRRRIGGAVVIEQTNVTEGDFPVDNDQWSSCGILLMSLTGKWQFGVVDIAVYILFVIENINFICLMKISIFFIK